MGRGVIRPCIDGRPARAAGLMDAGVAVTSAVISTYAGLTFLLDCEQLVRVSGRC